MEPLMKAYAGKADFYVLYTREAHPGENYPAHETFSDKVSNAHDMKRLENIERPILIDDLDGTMHRDYGARPNSIYVIGSDGVVLLRADWNDPKLLRAQLDRLLENHGNASGLEPLDVSDNFTAINAGAADAGRRVLLRAGYAAVVDFAASSLSLFRARSRAQP